MVDDAAGRRLTLSNLPPEIHLEILRHLPVLDYYHLKLAGCKRLTDAVRDVTGRLSKRKYMQELQAEDARRKNLRPGLTRSTMEIMIERGQTTLVHYYIRKYHSTARRAQPEYRYTQEKRVFHSALHWAVYYESKHIILLLSDQIDVRHGRVGWSALHVAAAYGKASVVGLLLANGADINALDARGKTPLQLADENGAEDVARLLRARQAAATLDEVAEKYPKEWPKHFGVNIRMRSRLPAPTRTWFPARHPQNLYNYFRRVRNGTFYASLREYFRGLRVGRGTDLRRLKINALEDAITRGCDPSVSILLEEGPAFDDRLIHHHPYIVRRAAYCKRSSIVRRVIADGVDLTGFFFEASGSGDIDRVQTYLEAGMDINTMRSGKTALHHAVSSNEPLMVRYLVTHGADVEASDPELKRTPLFEVDSSNSALSSLPYLLQAGANINAQDAKGNTLLHEAVTCPDTALFSILLKHEASLTLTEDNRASLFLNATGIHAIEYLLDAGVDVNTQDAKGRTKLHLVLGGEVTPDDFEIARLLLRRGATSRPEQN